MQPMINTSSDMLRYKRRRTYNGYDSSCYCNGRDNEDGSRSGAATSAAISAAISATDSTVQEVTTSTIREDDGEEGLPLVRAFLMDEIVSNISSFCDFETNVTGLRCITKKVNDIVRHELHQHSKSLLPYESKDWDMFISNEGLFVEVSARVYLHKTLSPEFKCRDTFFHNIKDSVYDEVEELSESVVEDGFKKAFEDLLHTNATIKFSDFEEKVSSVDQQGTNNRYRQQEEQGQQRNREREQEEQGVHVMKDEKIDIHDHGDINGEDSDIKYRHKQAVHQQKDWKLTFIQQQVTPQEPFKQLESQSKNEELDEVNTAPLLSIFHDLPFAMKQIDLEKLKKCLFGLLIDANLSSPIHYYRLSMNDRQTEGCAEKGLKGALTFTTKDNDEIEFGVEVWVQFDSPP